MKGIKLSKTSWLILAAGAFIVILAGLGLTRTQQLKEQSKVDEELSLSETLLERVQTTQLSQQLEDLRSRAEESDAQLKESQVRLHQSVISVDVTDEFFKIAEGSNVTVTDLSTTNIAEVNFDSIPLATIALRAMVEGTESDLVDFVINLNNGYATGKVQSVQISIDNSTGSASGAGQGGEESGDSGTGAATPSALINMIIYSYEG